MLVPKVRFPSGSSEDLLYSAGCDFWERASFRAAKNAGSEKFMQEDPQDAAKGNADPRDAEDLKARLTKLSSDLQSQRDKARTGETQRAGGDLTDKGLGQAMSLGFRVLSEFVAAIVVGALIGYQCDVWFGTNPFCLILFIGLGVAAGFWNIYRLAVHPPGPRGK